MQNTTPHLAKLLWEYNISELTKKDSIVLHRVLLFGSREDIRYVGLSNLKRYFEEKKPVLDEKSHNFWSVIFDIKNPSPPSFYDQINHPKPSRSLG